ncbi:Predicted membrane protein [Prochlorococcus marinus subsp. marinus str. CCMP1375]|uniref:Predicted membrane protein n=1 Tax=Prochlorococcus marinus (strain SARG / CCMP1375 / SS120) TaxID=167539 RepID=Q7VBW3_PROMA|nr:Predicted membrane protein [Prochlorococcus marinus subsp. marinus str. CCMP1375]
MMKFIIEKIINKRLRGPRALFHLGSFIIFFIVGRLLLELNLLDTYQSNIITSYSIIYQLLSYFAALIPVYMAIEWLRSWNEICIPVHSQTKNEHKNKIKNRKYLISLIVSIIAAYSALIFLIRFFIQSFIEIESNISIANSTLYFQQFKSYLFLIPYIVLIIYILVRRSVHSLFLLGTLIFYIPFSYNISNIEIDQINNIYSKYLIQYNANIILPSTHILVFISFTVLCGLLNYLIANTCLSDFQCRKLSITHFRHILSAISIYICCITFLVGITA